ncbi:hypothetical protein MNBD_CHLOROFLEXI01-3143 [hydrothermal vent metagenome]|uniref:Uncharacterized protein n=1 Tax=hydrothermal vent metagenome TaxID=652676 RepID=A0A3B0VAL2_9ZZZZ
MVKAEVEVLQGGRVQRMVLLAGERPFLYTQIIQKWQNDRAFRTFFIGLLADAPFDAYFWETPPVTRESLQRPFEFVLVDAPQLAQVQAEPRAFASYFSADPVVDFGNLGGDAHLVVPCPQTAVTAYPHLATFSRLAPIEQQHHFWQRVGTAVSNHVGERPLWVSTSGLGVYWLHVRLDSRPKYVTYRPYREWR